MNIDWGTFFISVPTTLILAGAAVKYLSKSYVDQYFRKELEKHKHDLQLLIEMNKFDLQRKVHDFNLYTSKKHEVYSDLYYMFLNAEGLSKRFFGLRRVPDYITYNAKELEQSLLSKGIPQVMVEQFTHNWDVDKQEKIDELKRYIRNFEIGEMRSAYAEVNNKYLYSRLYLSDKVSRLCEELTEVMWHYIVDVESIIENLFPPEDRRGLRNSKQANEEKMNGLLMELKVEMQKEISIGYYDKM